MGRILTVGLFYNIRAVFEMLEPYDEKLSRTVLRGERGCKTPDLPGMLMNMLKNINIKAILVGIVIAYVMNLIVSIVLFSGYENFITDDISTRAIFLIILSMFLQSSIPTYIAAIIAKQEVIIHSIILGTLFVLINAIGLIFESISIGFWWSIFFFCGMFLFAIIGGVIRKIEIEHFLKRDIANSI